jgi:hypothetical protein
LKDFSENCFLNIFRKSVEKIHFVKICTRRPTHIFDHISLILVLLRMRSVS